METTLKIIGAVIAVIASGVGVIAAVEQLTLRARLRRTTELTTKLVEQEKDPHRAAVLRSVHDLAAARLVTGWLLPWWQFIAIAVWFLGAPISLGGSIATQGLDAQQWVMSLFNFMVGSLVGRRGVRLYLERQRIVRDYLAGVRMEPPRVGILDQMEGGVRAEFLVGAAISAGTTLVAVGVGLLIHGPAIWNIPVAIMGAIGIWVSSDWIGARTVRPLEVAPPACAAQSRPSR